MRRILVVSALLAACSAPSNVAPEAEAGTPTVSSSSLGADVPIRMPAGAQNRLPQAPAAANAASSRILACGERENPCPLQAWMKRVPVNAMMSGSGPKLAEALEEIEKQAPPGFERWASIAAEGARKGKAGDVAGAKEACRVCHDLYKKQYIETIRDRPL